ncbi:oxidase ustYa family protein [Aspergillus foveolatus]|uniref:oxidase ustYa family protein n=1 Tax=Aspergillus foveolatus TaxID=210207 RepID=UPI003CCC8FFA
MMRPAGKGSEDRTKDHDRLLDDSEAVYPWSRQSNKAARYLGSSLGWTIVLFIIATALSCMIAPVIANVPIKYHRQRFNGSFLKENVYRQDAGPEVDAAWEALGANYRPIRVSVEEAAGSGITPDHVQISEAHGGGYPANSKRSLTLTAQNLLRQSLYYNYEYYRTKGDGAFRNDDFIVQKHVSHCLDILRQQLMCTIDVGVLGQVWVHPNHPSPFVDFNTEHVCRNFEDIREWAERNQLPLPAHGHGADGAPADFLVPPQKDKVMSEVP